MKPIRSLLSSPLLGAAHRKVQSWQSARPRLLVYSLVWAALVLGGYQLVRMTYTIAHADSVPAQRASQLLAIEESLDDAAISFGKQIQEWKDVLLRVENEERYNAHRKAFMEDSVGVQRALLQTRVAMQGIGLSTRDVDELASEHKALVSTYVAAQRELDARHPELSRTVDQRVLGIDRDFQRHIATVKGNVESLVKQQLAATSSAGAWQYLLIGLAASVLVMAFVALAFASVP